VIRETRPLDHQLPGRGWTLKKVGRWISQKLGLTVSKGLLHKLLHQLHLSWKKCKKLLGKANPQKRAEYLQTFAELYERMRRGEVELIYVDESHFHRDLDLGYTWSPVGERVWRISDCPGLAERINWYGAYNFTVGNCLIWNEGNCNKEHTADFLGRLAGWLKTSGSKDRKLVVIWDGAPWHTRSKLVQEAAAHHGFELVSLPGYSPDLNPIEGLWKWMREDVTQHQCYSSLTDLFHACKNFIDQINQNPLTVIDRLWPRFELDPEVEKLRISA
jgi:hypothetical protein